MKAGMVGIQPSRTPIPPVTDLAKSDGDGDAPHRVEVPLYEGLNGRDTALDVHLTHNVLYFLQLLHLRSEIQIEGNSFSLLLPSFLLVPALVWFWFGSHFRTPIFDSRFFFSPLHHHPLLVLCCSRCYNLLWIFLIKKLPKQKALNTLSLPIDATSCSRDYNSSTLHPVLWNRNRNRNRNRRNRNFLPWGTGNGTR
jgi:hypothetical protein